MAKVRTKTVLDNVLTHIQDQSAELRAKMLVWLNRIMQQTAIERQWRCLEKQASRTVTDGTILLPDDFGYFVNVKAGGPDDADGFFLEEKHRLSDEEAFNLGEDATADAPTGFVQTAANITFKPGLSAATVTLKYGPRVPNYGDDESDTVWPQEFGGAFERHLLTLYYEYDLDDRVGPSLGLSKSEIKALKKWENRQVPLPRNSPYLRGAGR